jgi:TolA-binding protein
MCARAYSRFLRVFFYYIAVLLILLSACGKTPLWSQSSGPLSNSSAGHLTTWTRLSGQFEQTLSQHEQTLTELSQKLEASGNNGARLTILSEELSKQNEHLKTYNEQIAERMQERDEDLAAAYNDIDRLKRQRLSLAVAVLVLGGFAAFAVWKTIGPFA